MQHSSAGIVFTLGRFSVFHPRGMTCCTDQGEICTSSINLVYRRASPTVKCFQWKICCPVKTVIKKNSFSVNISFLTSRNQILAFYCILCKKIVVVSVVGKNLKTKLSKHVMGISIKCKRNP